MTKIFGDQVRFGIHSGPQHTTYADYAALWKAAEDLGYDWASVFDHFIPIQSNPEGPCFEGLTLLSAMAALTTRIRCGVLVIGNTYRHPALLANIATTIDHVSNGRLELGVGAGWWEMEHEEYGIPLPPIGRRIRMLSESLPILKSLWTNHRTTFEGRYYQLADALCEPKPVQNPHIPLWVGGAGEQLTLRAVAQHADGWNTFFMPLDAYRHKLDVLTGHCRAANRDPRDIRKSFVVQVAAGKDAAAVDRRLDALGRSRGVSIEAIRERAVVGTPEQCVEQLMPYVEIGVDDFIVGARAPVDFETLELVATKIAPVVKERAAALRAKG